MINELTSTATRNSIQENPYTEHQAVLASLFRGDIPLRPSPQYLPLTPEQVKTLSELGIECYENEVYVAGLINLKLRASVKLNLHKFKEYLDHQAIIWLLRSDTLYQEYQDIEQEIQTRIKEKRPISYPLYERRSLKQKIGLHVLPADFSLLLEHPTGFQETISHKIGEYILSITKEHSAMSTSTMINMVQELQAGLLLDQEDSTPLIDMGPDYLPETKYPSIKATRKANERQAIESKARLANKIYQEIRPRLNRMTPPAKKQITAKIKSLRPSLNTIKAYYRAKGESPGVVQLLVTPQNYPDLPQVWITKKQQEVLLDIVNGEGNKHEAFINNGFLHP